MRINQAARDHRIGQFDRTSSQSNRGNSQRMWRKSSLAGAVFAGLFTNRKDVIEVEKLFAASKGENARRIGSSHRRGIKTNHQKRLSGMVQELRLSGRIILRYAIIWARRDLNYNLKYTVLPLIVIGAINGAIVSLVNLWQQPLK